MRPVVPLPGAHKRDQIAPRQRRLQLEEGLCTGLCAITSSAYGPCLYCTVSVTVESCWREPEVPATVILYVPAGVPV